jgi:5-methylcytosine-specific restriction endonuclease McrA
MDIRNRKRYLEMKKLIYRLDNGVCHICKKKVSYEKAVLDHIIPKAANGRGQDKSSDEYWNLRIAHKSCNSSRTNGRIAGQIRLNI